MADFDNGLPPDVDISDTGIESASFVDMPKDISKHSAISAISMVDGDEKEKSLRNIQQVAVATSDGGKNYMTYI